MVIRLFSADSCRLLQKLGCEQCAVCLMDHAFAVSHLELQDIVSHELQAYRWKDSSQLPLTIVVLFSKCGSS